MKQFKRILLVADRHVDGTAALARAIHLARDNGASLTLLDVLRKPAAEMPPAILAVAAVVGDWLGFSSARAFWPGSPWPRSVSSHWSSAP